MPEEAAERLFAGDGEHARLLREQDWAATPLGPVRDWPEPLRSAVLTLWPSALPMMLCWGPQLTQLYNEAFAPLLGDKHPAALGSPAHATWEALGLWADPLSVDEAARLGGGSSLVQDQLFLLNRRGIPEDTYWTVSASPIRGLNGVTAGMLVSAVEVTDRVIAQRRVNVLQDVGAVSSTEGDLAATCRAVIDVIEAHRRVVPSAVIYLPDSQDQKTAVAVCSFGTAPGLDGLGVALDETSAVGRAFLTGTAQVVTGSHDEPPPTAETAFSADTPQDELLLPLIPPGARVPVAVLAVGLSPHQTRDADYEGFARLLGAQVSILLGDAAAYAAQAVRADALAELDREKTRFYQNVSHEFRTPLTLIQNALPDLLANRAALSPNDVQSLQAARRAAGRLQRLVDGLLDFARADAGTLQPQPEPTDAAELTRDLASMFTSAFSAAGITFAVDVPDLEETVMLDREMWSQMQQNLLSNALKYTPSGGTVTMALRSTDGALRLTVTDTGIGIPESQQKAVFDRFHRLDTTAEPVRHAAGAGIGLALVAELVAAQRGRLELDSELARGSTFTLTIPAAADPRAPQPTADRRPDAQHHPLVPAVAPGPAALVSTVAESRGAGQRARRALLVEDDPDLRAYLTRLLAANGWDVDAAPDVAAALQTTTAPDLVLSDVMLPGDRDGLDLVRALRGVPALSRLPIILLTARAGARAAAEGLAAGADDFIRKPFNQTELLARLNTHYELAQLRDYALAHAESQAANLQNALASNRRIGAAIGILMNSFRLTEQQAFDRLRTASQHAHRKLHDVAEDVLLTGELPVAPGKAKP